jgi:transposase
VENGEYWLAVPIPFVYADETPIETFCGVDPGVRTMLTVFGSDGVTEYQHNSPRIERIDARLAALRKTPGITRHRRREKMVALEKRKKNLITELQWKSVHHLLHRNDVVFFGDIKSHDIVKGGSNRTLNRAMNNLKFYQFKQKLLFKATEKRKLVYLTKEHFTTKTCSACGALNDPGCSKTYHCEGCKRTTGRDTNAAKNILIKGILGY